MTYEHPIKEELIDYLHGELPAEEDARILAHLRTCEVCSHLYEEEARLSEMLRRYARATEREMPAGLLQSIRTQIRRDSRPAWQERLALLLRPVVAVPVAAAIAIGIYLGLDATQHSEAPKTAIDAAYYLNHHAAIAKIVPFGEGSVVPPSLQNDLAN
jgi:anti-sigma factor RsiW